MISQIKLWQIQILANFAWRENCIRQAVFEMHLKDFYCYLYGEVVI